MLTGVCKLAVPVDDQDRAKALDRHGWTTVHRQ
jgi:hypothetical protein